MREKNLDLMRQDIVSVLKNSSLAFVRELVGVDPVAVFRWAIVRAFFRGYFAFLEAGRKHRVLRVDGASRVPRASIHAPNDSLLVKYKSFRPRERAKKGLKNLQSVKTLAGRTAAPAGKRKQPLTVAAQFQHSLAALMETLNQANPFFIRCIKSNSDKVPNVFDEETVQRQLRYTGMLETVRIRQAGYNVRLTYEEFIQLYRILLPKGLLSSQNDVRHFLATLNLDRDNYQLGGTKIFMRESEQTKLEYRLHQQIMASIITIQRWFRAVLERRRFLALRRASLLIQGFCRQWLVARHEAATKVQAFFRGSRVRRWYLRLRDSVVAFQAASRGYLLRKTLPALRRRLPSPRNRNEHDSKAALAASEAETYKNRQSIEQIRNIIDLQLNMLIQEEAEKTRQLRQTQSLPIASLEKKRENLTIETSATQVFGKRRVSKTHNITELKQSNTSVNQSEANESSPDESWSVNSKKYPQGVAPPNKITPEDLANELLWLRIDQNYLMAEKNKIRDRERELAESIASSSEEYLRHAGDSSPVDSGDTNRSGSRRRGSPGYQRSLSSTTLEPAPPPLLSLPPVRREPRDAQPRPRRIGNNQHSTLSALQRAVEPPPLAPPAVPARAARRSPRRAPDQTDAEHNDHQDIKRAASELMTPLLEGAPLRARAGAGAAGGEAALRRRNSDPAPCDPRPADPRSTDYIGQTTNGLFRIAGHRFRKGTRFAKADKCVYCHQAIDAFVTQGQRCIDCKQLYHTKCIQNKGVITMPCNSPVSATRGRHKYRKPYMGTDQSKSSSSTNFNLTGTSEFMDRTDKIISDATELHAMQNFITKKIFQMESSENIKQSEVDRVFKHALREFKDNLVATYSVVETRGSALKYKDLIGNFLHVMETVCAREGSTLSITMGVNAFRGFMDEFMSQHDPDKGRTKRKKEKKRKVDDPIQYKGHTFILSMINIPTECEICKTFFMWPIERSLICQTCKLASHKKCYIKVSTQCRKEAGARAAAVVGAVGAGGRQQFGVLTGKVFGVPLCELPTGDSNIPIVADRLITTIEMTGLYTEGLYRKSGVSSKFERDAQGCEWVAWCNVAWVWARVSVQVGELRRLLDERPELGVERLDAYAVHVRASVLKGFFRDLPEPLLTFDLYDDFMLAAEITDPQEKVSSIFTILRKLPKPNFDLVERLIFHLARVALREDSNRMGPNALAIVFAPCILRTHKPQPAQDSLQDIARQTICLEAILTDKIRTVRTPRSRHLFRVSANSRSDALLGLTLTDAVDMERVGAYRKIVRGMLQDIATLDIASHTASDRLSSLRAAPRAAQRPEEQLLVGHIVEIQKEKAILTSNLPTLIRYPADSPIHDTTTELPIMFYTRPFGIVTRSLHTFSALLLSLSAVIEECLQARTIQYSIQMQRNRLATCNSLTN
ncbi:hypothetical protein MSG28_012282 [Choristoneura fumiferana]|uniref:Uncharacterized protein n=1 Tax=Choristoneura fumiferana TaxID=7141 RepID=A0ACC0KCI2_CHOFU|nr:hypothetical protein MSG28_012282 [Choristoneura fumiferana]